ncbi:hypothetical protein PMX22_15895 [Clostridium butyricum]|uniref:hypothetical protein n=1 Tax=Clostridium butyricum TaxID=1492 RepID=UPI00232A9C06|nr:hypothetical protein [Clostridium butyricum]MDB2161274.1 hypothetical protein [Clostridium butyricum]
MERENNKQVEEKVKEMPRDLEDYSQEELVEIVKKLAEIPCMDTTNLRGLAYDVKELAEGAKVGSRYAGMYLALISAGMEEDMAHAICINESTSKNNVEVAKLGAIQQQVSGTI